MNKFIYIGIVIVVAGIAYFLYTQTAQSPADTDIMESEQMNNIEANSQSETNNASDGPLLDMEMESEMEVNVDGEVRQFNLDAYNFGFSEETIIVNEGDTVTITVTSTDGLHDWVVEGFGAATERVSVGDMASVTFIADSAGEYEFYCSVGNHRAQGMTGTLIVQ